MKFTIRLEYTCTHVMCAAPLVLVNICVYFLCRHLCSSLYSHSPSNRYKPRPHHFHLHFPLHLHLHLHLHRPSSNIAPMAGGTRPANYNSANSQLKLSHPPPSRSYPSFGPAASASSSTPNRSALPAAVSELHNHLWNNRPFSSFASIASPIDTFAHIIAAAFDTTRTVPAFDVSRKYSLP